MERVLFDHDQARGGQLSEISVNQMPTEVENRKPLVDPDPAEMEKLVGVDPTFDASRESYCKFIEGKSASERRWWSRNTVALVTGANKGIGFDIVRRLAMEGMATIVTARSEERGMAAVNDLKAQGLENVLFHPLDVANPDSAAKLASWIKEKVGGIDILVANARVNALDVSYENAQFLLGTNYFRQRITISALLPLLRPSPAGACILFISSECGQIELLKSEKLKQKISNIDHLTEEQLDTLASRYLEDVKAGRQAEEWTTERCPQYNESKILLNAYGRVLAKALSKRSHGKKIYVNMMTPGFTTTDMSDNHLGARSVEERADTAIWLLHLETPPRCHCAAN